MRDVVERLIEMGARPKAINITAGGSRSALWAQIRADTLNLPAAVAAYPHTSPIAAALLGGIAAGEIPSLAVACRNLPRPSRLVEPAAASSRALDDFLSTLPDAFCIAEAAIRG